MWHSSCRRLQYLPSDRSLYQVPACTSTIRRVPRQLSPALSIRVFQLASKSGQNCEDTCVTRVPVQPRGRTSCGTAVSARDFARDLCSTTPPLSHIASTNPQMAMSGFLLAFDALYQRAESNGCVCGSNICETRAHSQ
jgi:hypothetical protein